MTHALESVSAAARATCAALANLAPDARRFLLVSSTQGVFETQTLGLHLWDGRVRFVAPTHPPVKGLVADIRGALSPGLGGGATILLIGSLKRPECWLFADPEEPGIWRLEPETRDHIKTCLAMAEAPPGWRRGFRLAV